MGADCKSVAKASEVRILYPPPASTKAPDLLRSSSGAFVVSGWHHRVGGLDRILGDARPVGFRPRAYEAGNLSLAGAWW
jgi:hypothetical protein